MELAAAAAARRGGPDRGRRRGLGVALMVADRGRGGRRDHGRRGARRAAGRHRPTPPLQTRGADGDGFDDEDGVQYQMDMMRCLREVNVDNNTVGWYGDERGERATRGTASPAAREKTPSDPHLPASS